jgi:hypothetical protein
MCARYIVLLVSWSACAACDVSTGPDDADAPEIQAAEPVDSEQRMRDSIAARWEREGVDRPWKERREKELREAVATAPFPPTLVLVLDCRTTVCRIVVEHAQPAERERFLAAMSVSAAFQQAVFGYFADGGTRRDTELWIARDDHPLGG